jgi:hypothetical protein
MALLQRKRLFRLGFASVAVTAFLGAAAGPAFADNGASKTPLLADSGGSCYSGASGGLTGYGFAIIKTNGNGTISAQVVLQNATPNQTYSLEIVQTPSGSGCFVGTATLSTNGQGNGTAHLSAAQLSGTTDAFIMINPVDALGYITTQDVNFG